jgi:hypothetical protein
MIKFCHISPTPHLDDFCKGNQAHLILAHLVETDEHYAYWYKQRKEFKILDNSAFEMYKQGRDMYSSDKLLEMGAKVKADVIVMSDYPNQHSSKTIEAAERLGPEFHADGYQTFFVPQSRIGDLEDYINAWDYAANSPHVDFIGNSILGAPNAFGNIEKGNKLQRFLSRWEIMRILDERGILEKLHKNGKKIHFLGMVDGPNEINLVRDYHKYIFSWDSSSAIWHGLLGVEYDNSPTGLINGKNETEVDFHFHTTDQKLIDTALYNRKIIERLTNVY